MQAHRRSAAAGTAAAVACLLLLLSACRDRREVEPAQPPALPYLGSGVLVTEDGHFLTVARVVAGARRIQAVICEQDRRHRAAARVIASDPRTGLVLCRADAHKGWALAWSTEEADISGERVACGWPIVALDRARSNEREVSLRLGPGDEETLGFPLAAGFEGGAVTTSDGAGLGIVAAVSDSSDLLAHPRVVSRDAVLAFLRAHGVDPKPARKRRSRTPAELAARIIWSVVRVEGDSAPPNPSPMPRLLWRVRLMGDEVTRLEFAETDAAGRARAIVARVWRSDGTALNVVLRASDGAITGQAQAPQTDEPSGSRTARSSTTDFSVDALGRLTATDRRTGRTLYEASARNGGHGFGVWDVPSLSGDGRLLLVGDALVWAPTGAALWRLSRRIDRAAALSRDGSAIAVARDARTVELWSLPSITPSGTTSPTGRPAGRPDPRR